MVFGFLSDLLMGKYSVICVLRRVDLASPLACVLIVVVLLADFSAFACVAVLVVLLCTGSLEGFNMETMNSSCIKSINTTSLSWTLVAIKFCIYSLGENICPTYFFLAFVVLPLKVSFFGVRESLSLDKAEDGERGESSLSLSSLSAWILWGVGGPVWGLLPSSPAEAGMGEVGVLGLVGVVAVAPAWLGLDGTFAELTDVGELWSCSSFRAWLRVQTVRLGGVVKAVTASALSA